MSRQDRLREYFKTRTSQMFAMSYLEVIRDLNAGSCAPGSVKVGDMTVPVITARLSPAELEYFGMQKRPSDGMEPGFRYLDNAETDEIVEICIKMKNGRLLALDLDPLLPVTRRWLAEVVSGSLYGFSFFCKEAKLLMTSFTSPDEEETRWLKRNEKRARYLDENDFPRMLGDSMAHDKKNGVAEKKYFVTIEADEDQCFIGDTSTLVPLENVKDYLY
jgi:hypothetical protein